MDLKASLKFTYKLIFNRIKSFTKRLIETTKNALKFINKFLL